MILIIAGLFFCFYSYSYSYSYSSLEKIFLFLFSALLSIILLYFNKPEDFRLFNDELTYASLTNLPFAFWLWLTFVFILGIACLFSIYKAVILHDNQKRGNDKSNQIVIIIFSILLFVLLLFVGIPLVETSNGYIACLYISLSSGFILGYCQRYGGIYFC